ncbi:MAG TPA: alpha/beta fold hydrolase [Burkholderiaceae bacterium]|nr:alpha/beta fold hydrolase [Burkholderiaceae bacterium]
MQTKDPSRSYVLAHGSWHGGWCWRPVADQLRKAGHQVFTPSFTGMGDRAHLLNESITLDTFIDDLVQLILAEELQDVILVGHSFAGVPISGVADRIPERLAHLVYFDAVVLEDGQHSFSNYPPEEAENRIAAAGRSTGGLAVPVPDPLPPAWGLSPDMPEYEWIKRRLTAHPARTYTSPIHLQNPLGNGVPKTYIHCRNPELGLLESSRQLVRQQAEWHWLDVDAGHEAHITHPNLIANILLEKILVK